MSSRERRDEKEHRSPTPGVDEHAAHNGTDGRRQRRGACPCANRTPALVLIKVRADQRQAAGNKERAADALHESCGHEHRQ